MTSVARWIWGSAPVQHRQDIELGERKVIHPLPSAPELSDHDIHAVHIASKQQLVQILKELNKIDGAKEALLARCTENDELCHIATEILNEDLTASTLVIEDDEKTAQWMAEKKAQYQQWCAEQQPEPAWRYQDLVAKPARAIWWTGKSVYKVWKVANSIIVPIGIAVTVIQSPWTNVLLYLLKKILK